MRAYALVLFSLLLFIACQKHAHPKVEGKPAADSHLDVSALDAGQVKLYSFLNIDSIAEADYAFIGFEVDSIAFEKLAFEAVYLYCFKGRVREKNYQYLKMHNPAEYNAITTIHTAHRVLVNDREYSFNGKGKLGCLQSISESTQVSIESHVISYFSNRKQLGKFVILESIVKMQ